MGIKFQNTGLRARGAFGFRSQLPVGQSAIDTTSSPTLFGLQAIDPTCQVANQQTKTNAHEEQPLGPQKPLNPTLIS